MHGFAFLLSAMVMATQSAMCRTGGRVQPIVIARLMNDAQFEIPSISTLIAFEATARLGGVKRAADELNTSQSAISRYIRSLEMSLEVTLFDRRNRRVVLTKRGEDYRVAVRAALESLHAAGRGLRTQGALLTIGCTPEVSVLLLRPVFSRLKRALPDGVNLRVLSCDYDTIRLVVPTGVDIVVEYSAPRTDAGSARILDEEIVPVASPAFRRRFERVLGGHPRHWTGVPRLELAPRDQGWATWTDWFVAHDCEPPQAPVESFENYIHLLEAAVNGDGLAIGWNGFMRGYFNTERLVPLRDEWLASSIGLYATLTPHGRMNPDATRCLRELALLGPEVADVRAVSLCELSR